MEIIKTDFDSLLILQSTAFKDERGTFQKIFNEECYRLFGLVTDFKELYFSVTKRGVIRGMHFQLPPFDCEKLVYVSKGKILDVVVDLRKNSKMYKKCYSTELDDELGKFLYIPKGFAHGFTSLSEECIVNYAQTSCYSKEHDCGVASTSIEFDWNVENPIQSGRDLSFKTVNEFTSPF
jgi:dTDP-4-dehydrorhamnose 3,5-epimerase